MTMTMLMKSLVTCHTFGVTSSLTRALLGPVSPRVGCGIKMGQARYTAQISVPTTVQYFSYNTSTLSTLQRRLPYNALAARLCALCPPVYHSVVPTTVCPPHYIPAYLTILIESDEGQIEKALNTRMFRCCLFNRATNVTLSCCPMPFPVNEMPFTIKLLGTSAPSAQRQTAWDFKKRYLW